MTIAPALKAILKTGKLSAWTIESQLGIGGFGAVFRASKKLIDGSKQEVALKVVSPASKDAGQASRLLRHEFEVLRHLDNPYVAKVVDSGIEEVEVSGVSYPILWIATDLVKGATLGAEISEHGVLERGQWLELAHDILHGISAAHEANIVHLDIKPANIMRFSRRSVIIDFGGASYVDVADEGDIGVYTFGFAAPEQVDGRTAPEDYQFEVDLFSIGAVLAFAGTGVLPWDLPSGRNLRGEDIATRVMSKALQNEYFETLKSKEPRLNGLEEDQASLVSKLLQLDPANRGTAVEALEKVKELLPPGSARREGKISSQPVRGRFNSSPSLAVNSNSGPAKNTEPSDKHFKTVFYFALLLGPAGLDRFYVGKVGTGILKLLGFGWYGVWWILDLARLVNGEFSDSLGRKLVPSEDEKKFAKRMMKIFVPLSVLFWVIFIVIMYSQGSQA
jgi:serine/threonine protein kinase